MDLMQVRRRLMAQATEKDYLKGVEWVEKKYISQNGIISNGDILKYTESIHLSEGVYIFAGTMESQGAVYTRIHAYDAEDKWIRQLMTLYIETNSRFSKEITVPSDVYAIRISTGITVEATLTKA